MTRARITITSLLYAVACCLLPVVSAGQVPARLERPQTGCTLFVASGQSIQDAVNLLPPEGGTICLGPGTHTVTGTGIHLGDGSTTQKSTKHAIAIRGVAAPVPNSIQMTTVAPVTMIDCTGTDDGECITVDGPDAVDVRNVYLKGVAGTKSRGILVISSRYGTYKHIAIEGFDKGIETTTWASFSPGGNFDSLRNVFEHINIRQGSNTTSTHGLHVHSATASANSDFNHFRAITIGPRSNAAYFCIEIGWADGNIFEGIHCTGGASNSGIRFNYSEHNGPINNSFFALDVATAVISNNGSPGSNNPNFIFSFAENNGGTCPSLANLQTIGCSTSYFQQMAQRGTTSGVISFLAQAAAGTYNWNWPTSPGSSGQPLLSGGGSTAMTFGTLGVGAGGTNLTASADDNVMVGNDSTWESKALPDCDDSGGNHLNYDTATNAFSCGTSSSGSGSLTVKEADNTPTVNGVSEIIVSNGTLTDNGSGSITIATGGGGGGTVFFHEPGLRLTTETGVPVSTSDRTSQGTIYWTPFKSGVVTCYNGSALEQQTITSDKSLSLTLTSGNNYDVFYDCDGGTLSVASAWTNATTRADAISRHSSCACFTLSSDATKLWLGTIRASGSNVVEDSAAKRFVWNTYNRVRGALARKESTATWNYTTSSWRQANNSAANQVEVVTGLAGLQINVTVVGRAANTNTFVSPLVGIGEDSTTAEHAQSLFSGSQIDTANSFYQLNAFLNAQVPLGYHFYAWLEWSTATGTTTWQGFSSGLVHSGLSGSFEY